MSLILRQSGALLIDAYRELNSKKLFWVTMVMSVCVVAIIGMFGINERGLSFLAWTWDFDLFNTTVVPKSLFYKFVFAQLGIPVWLTWVAAILALISTASIFPDFLAGGAIELTLSKPISRVRLFFTKFLTGLLFVALQVSVFTLASFIVIGVRGSSWEWGLWLAVPIVVLFFSYLFALCTLFGVLTRSTIASLLLTLVVWVALFMLNTTDTIFLQQRESSALQAQRLEQRVEKREKIAAATLAEKGVASPTRAQLDEADGVLAMLRPDLEKKHDSARSWKKWSGIVFALKTALPKTSETAALLGRSLMSRDDLDRFMPGGGSAGDEDSSRRGPDPEVNRRVEDALRDRTTAWVLGTSLAFEGLVLAIACWIFCRRDF